MPNATAERRAPTAQSEPVKDNPKYRQLVEDTAELVRKGNKEVLTFYYQLGERVNDLTQSGGKYGEKSIEQFAKDLKDVSGITLGLSSLYKAGRFNQAFDTQGLRRLIQVGWSWRNVAFISQSQVPSSIRTKLIAKVEAGELQQNKVKDAVVAEIPALGRVRRPNRKPDVMFDKLTGLTKLYRERLDVLPKLVTKVNSFKPNARAPFKEKVDAARAELKATIEAARNHLKELEEIKFE